MAAVLAHSGLRVGVIDSDVMSPCLHILLGAKVPDVERELDSLAGPLAIQQVAWNVTSHLGDDVQGQLFVIPKERIFQSPDGLDVSLLYDRFQSAIKSLHLDVVLVDVRSGLTEEALIATALSDALVIVMRPDRQDYQGTAVMVAIARHLDVPRLLLVVNEVPSAYDLADVKAQVEQTYNCEVGAVLPYCEQMIQLGSSGVFAVCYPDHPITHAVRQVATSVMG